MNRNAAIVILVIIIALAGFFVVRSTGGSKRIPDFANEYPRELIDVETGERIMMTEGEVSKLPVEDQDDPDADWPWLYLNEKTGKYTLRDVQALDNLGKDAPPERVIPPEDEE